MIVKYITRLRLFSFCLLMLSLSACNIDSRDLTLSDKTFQVSIEGIPQEIIGDQAVIAEAIVDSGVDPEYLWLLNGQLISTEKFVDLSSLVDGRYLLKLIVKDKVSKMQVESSTQFSISGRSNQQFYFGYGSYWKYLDNGSSQREEWTSVNFDDSTWKTGRGLFGYGVSAQNTFLSDYRKSDFGGAKPTSYYFRKALAVDNINALKDVYLNMVVDDAAIIYVNGVEIARSPYMVSGDIAFDSILPTFTRFPDDEFTFVLPANAFSQGINVIAVRVINQSISSSDVAFDAALKANDVYQGYSDGPYVFYENGLVIVNTLTPNGFTAKQYNTSADAKVTVTLPADLGQFDVQLQGSFVPPPYRYTAPSKFFVTSDIEGNIEALVYMLVEAGIMDRYFNWTYGTGHFYHIGDLFDRGGYVAQSLWLLYHLEAQARVAGGDVHVLLGNHDMMNLYGDFRYVHPRYYKNASYMGKPLIEVYSEDTELGRWLRSKNVLEIAGDNLFVHAGFTPELIDRITDNSIPLEEINEIGRQHTVAGYKVGDRNFYLVSRFYWDRNIAREVTSQQEVERGLTLFSAQRMIIGHTVFDKPTYLYDDKVLAVDVHHHENYQREKYVQGVEFINGQFVHFVASQEAGITREDIVSSIIP